MNEGYRRYPHTTVIATSTEGLTYDDHHAVQLVRPKEALRYVAWGDLIGPPRIRRWLDFAPWEMSYSTGAESGRQDGAMRLVCSRLRSGDVSCYFIDAAVGFDGAMAEPGAPLELLRIDPSVWADGASMDQSDRGSFYGYCLEPLGAAALPLLYNFFFLWSEIYSLVDPAHEDDLDVRPFDRPARSDGLGAASSLREASSRGARPKNHGAPLASFLARITREGVDGAAQEKDETLGSWLQDEYRTVGETPPSLRNASRDARAALEAWRGKGT